MIVHEEEKYSRDYLDPDKRSIASNVTITMKDGTQYGPVEVEYPIGHRRRRQEGLPLLFQKFENNLLTKFDNERTQQLADIMQNHARLLSLPVSQLVDLFCSK